MCFKLQVLCYHSQGTGYRSETNQSSSLTKTLLVSGPAWGQHMTLSRDLIFKMCHAELGVGTFRFCWEVLMALANQSIQQKCIRFYFSEV